MNKNYNLSIETLNVFCKVVEQNGFHAAAHFLELSEPSVSFKVKRAEECMNTVLIERGRPLRLTESGAAFYQYAKKAVADYEQVLQKIDVLEKGLGGELNIAAGVSVSKYLLSSVCGKMLSERPEVRINILNCSSQEVCDKVLDGTADLGFTIRDTQINNELSGQIIAINQEVVAARHNHPLAAKKAVKPQELLNYSFVTSTELDNYQRIKSGFLKKTKITIGKSNIVLEDFDMAKRCIKDCDALLIGPAFSFSEEFRQGTLIPLKVEGESYYSKIRLIKRKDKVMSVVQKDFIKLAKEIFQSRLS